MAVTLAPTQNFKTAAYLNRDPRDGLHAERTLTRQRKTHLELLAEEMMRTHRTNRGHDTNGSRYRYHWSRIRLTAKDRLDYNDLSYLTNFWLNDYEVWVTNGNAYLLVSRCPWQGPNNDHPTRFQKDGTISCPCQPRGEEN